MRSLRSGRQFLPASLLAAGCFVISAGGCGQASQSAANIETQASPVTVSAPQKRAALETAAAVPLHSTPAVQPAVERSQPVSTPAVAKGNEFEQKLGAHLAAGEFGAAARLVDRVNVSPERTLFLQQVAEAQVAAGEVLPARQFASRLPASAQQAILDQALNDGSAPSLAGGGSGADFTELVALIQTLTSGPWFDIDGVGGSLAPYTTGVNVNPLGRMELLATADGSGRLADLAAKSRNADLGTAMEMTSPLRVVSLTRLERAVAMEVAANRPIPSSMLHLAGLTRVQHVFVDEATNEIWIAGPAEGWKYDDRGAARGRDSGQPVLLLDDLVTVLRTFSPTGVNAFQCLIVPRQEGLAAVQEYATTSANRGSLRAGSGVRNFVNRLEELLGEQDVEVNGVPATSHVARVIVEADYRMKLIGIDKHQAADLPSFFDLLTVTSGDEATETNALRWWLTTNYEAVLHNGDKTAFEIVGPAIKCLSENEFVNAQGERVQTGKTEATNRLFAQRFTNGYEELAREDFVFAELRNIFDLAMTAAIIRSEGLDRRTNWDRGVFAEGGVPTAIYPVAKTVDTVANHRVYNGKDVVVQVAGGVQADLISTLKSSEIRREAIRGKRAADVAPEATVPENRWWWDVAAEK